MVGNTHEVRIRVDQYNHEVRDAPDNRDRARPGSGSMTPSDLRRQKVENMRQDPVAGEIGRDIQDNVVRGRRTGKATALGRYRVTDVNPLTGKKSYRYLQDERGYRGPDIRINEPGTVVTNRETIKSKRGGKVVKTIKETSRRVYTDVVDFEKRTRAQKASVYNPVTAVQGGRGTAEYYARYGHGDEELQYAGEGLGVPSMPGAMGGGEYGSEAERAMWMRTKHGSKAAWRKHIERLQRRAAKKRAHAAMLAERARARTQLMGGEWRSPKMGGYVPQPGGGVPEAGEADPMAFVRLAEGTLDPLAMPAWAALPGDTRTAAEPGGTAPGELQQKAAERLERKEAKRWYSDIRKKKAQRIKWAAEAKRQNKIAAEAELEAYRKSFWGRLEGAAIWATKDFGMGKIDDIGKSMDRMTYMMRAGSSFAMRSVRFAGPVGLMALMWFSQNASFIPAIGQFVIRALGVKGGPLNRDAVRAVGTISRDTMMIDRQRERDMGEDPLLLAYTNGYSPPDSFYTSQESVDRIRVQLGTRDYDHVGTRESVIVPGAA